MKYVGYIAAILTTFSFLPQALQVIRTKNTTGINLTMYTMFVVGVACWTIYGISLRDIALTAANTVTGLFASIVLVYKLRYR
jgi:MtN3 and saliva related transmembrane protein